MVVVEAVQGLDVQCRMRLHGEGLEELSDEFGVEGADLRPVEGRPEHQKGAAGEVERHAGQRLVHRQVHIGVAGDAALVAERLPHRLTERKACILHGMVIVDLEVALGVDPEIDQGVTTDLVEHMIEEADAGLHIGGAAAVQIHLEFDSGLPRVPLHRGLTHPVLLIHHF